MSRWTTQLRFIVNQTLDDLNLKHDEENWHYVYEKLGLNDYPIFDEHYREILNNKIIRHYYTREIGAETAARFAWFLRDAMFLIMPFYNQLYESEIKAHNLNPFDERDWRRVDRATGRQHGTSSNSSESGNEGQDVYQDTPQSEMIPAQIKEMKYATAVNLGKSKSNSSAQGSADSNYDNTITRTEQGRTKSAYELLKTYRETFLNIDYDIINNKEIANCFMTLW